MKNYPEKTEYLLVAHPDKSTLEKIVSEQSNFSDTYQHKQNSGSKPFILISNFFADDGMESTLVRWLQKICSLEQGFSLTLNNYSGFPNHTIFLRIPDASPIHNFVTQLGAMKDFIKPVSPGFFRRPHVPIATNLSQALYEQALSDYSRMSFHETFLVKELILMKRNDVYDAMKTVQVFGLLPAGNDLFNKVA